MGAGPAQKYESQMLDLNREYKSLSFEDRKRRFTEFIRREADIFAKCIDEASINNVSNDAFEEMMLKRNHYLKNLFDTKDICVIF